jgi:hypothetical protein
MTSLSKNWLILLLPIVETGIIAAATPTDSRRNREAECHGTAVYDLN